jgi:hypothetical protein
MTMADGCGGWKPLKKPWFCVVHISSLHKVVLHNSFEHLLTCGILVCPSI